MESDQASSDFNDPAFPPVEGPIGTLRRGGAYEPPKNVQFSVFLDNRVGKLYELLRVFEGHALRLAGLSVVDSADHAVVRILTSSSELGRRLLKRNNMPFSETDVLAVELTNSQSLAQVCAGLLCAELNVHFAYPLLVHPHGHSAVALHCDDYVLAGQVLRRKGFVLLGENDLGDNINPSDPGGPGRSAGPDDVLD